MHRQLLCEVVEAAVERLATGALDGVVRRALGRRRGRAPTAALLVVAVVGLGAVLGRAGVLAAAADRRGRIRAAAAHVGRERGRRVPGGVLVVLKEVEVVGAAVRRRHAGHDRREAAVAGAHVEHPERVHHRERGHDEAGGRRGGGDGEGRTNRGVVTVAGFAGVARGLRCVRWWSLADASCRRASAPCPRESAPPGGVALRKRRRAPRARQTRRRRGRRPQTTARPIWLGFR